AGTGVYLRTDYWNNEAADDRAVQAVVDLSAITDGLVYLTPHHNARIQATAHVQQIVMDPPRRSDGEDAMVLAPMHYRPIVKAAWQTLEPVYVYARGAAGQSVSAELSREPGVPSAVRHRAS